MFLSIHITEEKGTQKVEQITLFQINLFTHLVLCCAFIASNLNVVGRYLDPPTIIM